MFQTKVVKKIKSHILHSTHFSKNRKIYKTVWKIW